MVHRRLRARFLWATAFEEGEVMALQAGNTIIFNIYCYHPATTARRDEILSRILNAVGCDQIETYMLVGG